MIVEELKGVRKEDYVEPQGGGESGREENGEEQEELTAEEEMMKVMGIGGFGSTKGKQVESNSSGAALGSAKTVCYVMVVCVVLLFIL